MCSIGTNKNKFEKRAKNIAHRCQAANSLHQDSPGNLKAGLKFKPSDTKPPLSSISKKRIAQSQSVRPKLTEDKLRHSARYFHSI